MSQWSVSLHALAEKAKGDLATVARKATFELFRAVVLRSPVDTGRFRANWNISYGAPEYSTSASTAEGRGIQQAALALTLPVGGVVWLSNGLPYGPRLEHGWSKQAPAGMVRLSALEFDDYVRAAVTA